ncbi:MAG: TrbG/VirB9 family P-type conjugative transfer protein [Steroidobacteraceae bacterium]
MLQRRWIRGVLPLALGVAGLMSAGMRAAMAKPAATPGGANPRVRFVRYRVDRIYALRGRVGYEIDLQFAPGEHFVGLGVGDAKGVAVAAAGNHLFIKPRATHVATDLTVLTNRRTYLFDYRVAPPAAGHRTHAPIYAVRFEYPRAHRRHSAAARNRQRVARALAAAERPAVRNEDYWYCGARAIEPSAAWDDGVQTHLVFPPAAQLPAVFVLHADGSESLVDFNMRGDQMVIDRVARRFVLKRGRLRGRIVNRGFAHSQRRLASETISPRVWRITRRPGGGEAAPEASGARP